MTDTPLYPPQMAELWRRIELEQPATYWEDNVVEGRREVWNKLRRWLGPPADLEILDAGCGYGRIARRLAADGGRVLACDVREEVIERARQDLEGDNPTFVVEDLRTTLERQPDLDVILLLEVLEDFGGMPYDVIGLLGSCRARRLLVGIRTSSSWSRLLEPLLPPGLEADLDPILLLRALHLETPFRLQRQHIFKRRNFGLQLMELARPE